MASKAILRYSRVPARKARLVIDMIRGRNVSDAISMLKVTPKKGAKLILSTLNSAIANASSTGTVDVDNLFVKTITVDEGPTLKRFTPRAQGRATKINKRTSHITVVVDER
ncbi:MAG: 50S ribosomal protein L22 [Bdellovibrionota bacterium]